ncbi:hypothetical protein, partial [Shigella dysenteriae]|uniref:hypothetical protein n=1 Tax=Shigella dysenteriae TaxID=622 RepID=UPI0034A2DC16
QSHRALSEHKTLSISWSHYLEPGLIKRDMGELLKILKKHIDEAMNTQVLSSNFCKLVCIYDYIKNSHRY